MSFSALSFPMTHFPWYMLLLIVLFTASISYWLTLRLVDYLASKNITDIPNQRSLHSNVIPRGGGVVFVGLLFVILLTVSAVSHNIGYFMIALYVIAWAILSAADDIHNLSPKIRFFVQFIFALLAVIYWGPITEFELASDLQIQLSWAAYVATVLGILWMANLYNFMDGMDGLAASQAIVAAITMAFWFSAAGDFGLALVNLVLAAACYGFIQCNWSPAKLFMGDVGSVTLGAYFALMIVIASVKYEISVISFIILFAVFVFDATLTLLQRAIRGEKVWQAHNQHSYQQVAKLGYPHSKIVIAMLVLMVIQSLLATLTIQNRDMIIPIVILSIFMLGSVVFLARKLKKNKSND